MAHPPAWRSSDTCDVADNGLADVLLDVIGRLFLFDAADLADEHDRLGVGVRLESFETVDEGRPRDRVATDPDTRRDTDPHLFQFVKRLIGEGAAPAHDPHRAAGESDLARSNTDIALPGADNTRAVGADETGRRVKVLELAVHTGFVLGRDPLGYANDYLHSGGRCFKY